MTMDKIAITIPRETLEKARGAIRRSRSSLSAYISRAVEKQAQEDDLEALLDDMRAERGERRMTAKERRAADLLLFGPAKKRPGR